MDLEATCIRLRKAMKGFGTNEKEIIDVLATHCNYELQLIKDHYKTMYGRVGSPKLYRLTQTINEPVHEKTNNLHRRKQRRRSASR